MRTIVESFNANEIKQFAIPGGRIEILSCSAAAPVSISLQNANGVEITSGFAKDIDAGSYMQPAGGFQRVAITSSAAQNVKFLISNGESGTRSVAGTVAVAGTVSITGAVNINDVIGANSRLDFFNAATTIGNNQVTTHILPAANVNGILLRQLSLICAPGGGGAVYMRAVAAQAAPTGLLSSQANAITLAYLSSTNSAVTAQKDVDVMYRRIPAGWGIYTVTQVVTAAAASATLGLGYEIL